MSDSVLNFQKPVAVNRDKRGILEISNMQIELKQRPPFQGCRCISIILYGCTEQCPTCYENYTQRSEPHTVQKVISRISDMVNSDVIQFPNCPDTILITGGEPFRQNIVPLCNSLLRANYRVVVETNGALFLPGLTDLVSSHPMFWLVISPKTNKMVLAAAELAKCYVYPIRYRFVNPENGLPSNILGMDIAPDINTGNSQIFLIPEYSLDSQERMLNTIAAKDSCLQFGYTFAPNEL